jgi:hypothetical protein
MAELVHPDMARLRRTLETTDPEVEAFVERLGSAFMDQLSEPEAARFEHMMATLAQAAKELGYDATTEQIMARANELRDRPT